ncbi:MAG: Gfo/Idh/MocA family oxidoreductase [Phycisphaerales bacterium]
MSELSIGVGIIGLGFMGRTHLAAYQRAERDGFPCRVVAVSDQDERRLTGAAPSGGNLDSRAGSDRLFDPGKVRTYSDADGLLSDADVQLVSICTHTDTHVDLALRALRAGKHVLVEKPVALTCEAVEELILESRRVDRICMPAMCMRFWPGWDWLKEAVAGERFGGVISARFERLGAAPSWASGFYTNFERSGGALFDLHVHDVDFLHFLFGAPSGVHSAGTPAHLTTLFEYDTVPGQVVAEGGWLTWPDFPFRMRYVVEFEGAVADFDLARDPSLRVYAQGNAGEPSVSSLTGYDGEVRHAVQLAAGLIKRPIAPLTDALAVTRTILAERASLQKGCPVGLGS